MPCPCGYTYCWRGCSKATQEAYQHMKEDDQLRWELQQEYEKDAKEEKEGTYR